MSLTLVTAPAAEPVSLEEAKLHLRVDSDADDDLVATLIEAARNNVEAHTSRALVNQTWDLKLDTFPPSHIFELPRPPLSSVTSITYVDIDGVEQTWASADYTVQANAGPYSMPGTVALAYGASYPTHRSQPDAVTVRFVAGYGADGSSVPAAIRQAVLLLIGEMYARREVAIAGTIISRIPFGVDSLLASFRAGRL